MPYADMQGKDENLLKQNFVKNQRCTQKPQNHLAQNSK